MTDGSTLETNDSRDSVEGALIWLSTATAIWLAAFFLALTAGLNFLAGAVGIFGFLNLPELVSALSKWKSRPRRHHSTGYLRAAMNYRGSAVWAVYTQAGQLALVLFFAVTG